MADIGKDINKAKQLLVEGQLVSVPTETVYGLAANALDADAVVKIFDVKGRPRFDPLIVHVSSFRDAGRFVEAIPPKAVLLAERFWPGPLTLVLNRSADIPDIVTAGLDTVGVRCPDHPLTRALLSELPFPLAAPSANPFGYVSPTTAAHVNEQLGDKIPYILDGGPCTVGIESTIIGFEDGDAVVYRMGGLPLERLEEITGPLKVQTHSASDPRAPGQLKSHYAPSKRVILGKIETLLEKYPAHCSGLLTFAADFNSPYQVVLSPSGNLEEAAKHLFSALRRFETMPIDVILAESVPDTGLGRAINDRLRRAAANL